MDKSLILNKIKEYYNFKTDSQFAKFLGVASTTLSSWHKRNTFDHDLIYAKCVEVSPDFLLSGEGDIERKYINEATEIASLKDPAESEIIRQSGNEFIDIGNGKMQMLIPLVDQYAYAGYLSGWSDEEFIHELPKFSIIVEKQHRGSYKAFNVRGDSMDDNTKSAISAGEVVVGRLINKQYWTSKLHLNQWQDYIIVHETGIIVKRIVAHDVENGIITCLSLNPDKNLYPNLEIKLSEVYELYNIIQVVRNR